MLLAEFDPIQIAIVVIAMVAGFLQWLWKVIQQGVEEKKRSDATLDPEEKRRRDEAWRRQTQSHQPTIPQRNQRPSPTATPPPIHDPWSTVRDVFEKMKEEMTRGQADPARPAPAQPPTLPSHPVPLPQHQGPRPVPETVRAEIQPAPRGATAAHTPRSAPLPEPHRVRTPVSLLSRQVSTTPSVRLPRADNHGLRAFLANPTSLRQAILLKEVLGPPKSLQSSGDSPL